MKKFTQHLQMKLQRIKKAMGDFDLAAPGTIRTIYMKCGKATCSCQKNKKDRHGPYNLWDRKVNGRPTSKMISQNQFKQMSQWIEQRKRLEKLVAQAIVISQQIALEEFET